MRVKTMKGGVSRLMSMFTMLFDQRPLKRNKGRIPKAVAKRRKANKVARRSRRVNRMRQRPHRRKRA